MVVDQTIPVGTFILSGAQLWTRMALRTSVMQSMPRDLCNKMDANRVLLGKAATRLLITGARNPAFVDKGRARKIARTLVVVQMQYIQIGHGINLGRNRACQVIRMKRETFQYFLSEGGSGGLYIQNKSTMNSSLYVENSPFKYFKSPS
jgi:hypothetical protein